MEGLLKFFMWLHTNAANLPSGTFDNTFCMLTDHHCGTKITPDPWNAKYEKKNFAGMEVKTFPESKKNILPL